MKTMQVYRFFKKSNFAVLSLVFHRQGNMSYDTRNRGMSLEFTRCRYEPSSYIFSLRLVLSVHFNQSGIASCYHTNILNSGAVITCNGTCQFLAQGE